MHESEKYAATHRKGYRLHGHNFWRLRQVDKAKRKKKKVKSLSRVRLLVTPWTAAYQAPLSMRFSREPPYFAYEYTCYFNNIINHLNISLMALIYLTILTLTNVLN